MPTLIRRITLLLFALVFPLLAKAVTADFTADHISGCCPLVVHFTNTSSGASTYEWDLGNGTTSTYTDVSGSYITPGTYTVTLTAISGSTRVTHTMTITVYPTPTVSFTASDTTLCPGTSTTFTSTTVLGVSGPATYLWTFGDGFTSTLSNPTHTYATSGTYNVSLMVTNSQGCYSTLFKGGYIYVYPHSAIRVSASNVYFCSPPAHVVFSTTITGASPYSYYWTFGDGHTSTSATPTNDYSSTGSYNVSLAIIDSNGCRDTLNLPNYITVTTISSSIIGPTSACQYSFVSFTNSSSTHTSAVWDFGDSGFGAGDSVRHMYTTAGTYRVRLIVRNGPCSDTSYQDITIYPAPNPTIITSPRHPCPPPTTVTYSTSGVSSGTYSWHFGDGVISSGATPSHTYASAGVYSDTLYITDSHGCNGTVIFQDTVRDLYGMITDSNFYGCIPLTVSFWDSARTSFPTPGAYPDSITSYYWDFGDGGSVSGSPHPTHTYTAAGTYTVTCRITTANGCVVTNSTLVYAGTPPRAIFTVTPDSICFHGGWVTTTITVLSGPVTDFHWFWGDGSGDRDTSTTLVRGHHYIRPGYDTIILIPYNNGCRGIGDTFFTITVDSPMAIIHDTFTCSPRRRVIFADSSWGDTWHEWYFSDGYTSLATTVDHTFPRDTIYTVKLVTYNSRSGCRDTTEEIINLIPPRIAIHVSDSTICLHDTARVWIDELTGVGTSAIFMFDPFVSMAWLDSTRRWGGEIDSFGAPGVYTVTVVYYDQHGCPDTMVRPDLVTVGHPINVVHPSIDSGCWPLSVVFTDSSRDTRGVSITSYIWAFGDGYTATTTTGVVAHTYTTAGTFHITQILTDNIGCTDTAVLDTIQVFRPHAAFNISTRTPCRGQTVTFTNTSTGSGGVSGYYWIFGDGSTSTVTSPTHIYTANGTYTVKLGLTDGHGCTDTALFVNWVSVTSPAASFNMSDSFTICPPLNVTYLNTSTGATGYRWDLGDGTTSSIFSPTDLYVSPALYHIVLVAYNAAGCTDTARHDVMVYGYAGAFTYDPDTGCAPLTVHFSAHIANVPSIIWDFADGNTTIASLVDTASHTYLQPGAYLPKLVLSDNTGCRNSSVGIDTIKVDAVLVKATTNPSPVCVKTNINFVDSSYSYFSHVTQYLWTLPDGTTSTSPSPGFYFDTIGTFVVELTATDAWGCVGHGRDTMRIYPWPTIVASPDTIICFRDSATIFANGGISYTWLPTAGLGCPTCQSTTARPSADQTYTVKGTDIHGCSNVDSVTVSLRYRTVSTAFHDTDVCKNVAIQLNDTGATIFNWVPATGLSDPHVANPIATPPATTVYTVYASYGTCDPDTNYVNFIVYPLPTVDAGADQHLVAGTEVDLSATGTLIDRYLWEPYRSVNCDTCKDIVAHIMSTTTFTVTVTSIHGCKSSDTVKVWLFCDQSQIFVPNTFTPNNDGQNDVFYPRGSGISTIKSFRIYNRWGELMFERNNININDATNAWDGSYLGGEPRSDVYVYLIDATCDTGTPIFVKGDVTIVR